MIAFTAINASIIPSLFVTARKKRKPKQSDLDILQQHIVSELLKVSASPSTPIQHVVLLVPGIRDYGQWTQKAKKIFEKHPGCKAFRISHGFFDLVRFVAPGDNSQSTYENVVSQYQTALREYKDAKVSLVGHSFGTYLIGRLLNEFDCDRLGRVLLCGSVLPQDYDWANVRDLFTLENPVLNQCGHSDNWPVRADLARRRYGSAGKYGFRGIFPDNQWYLGGHSLFFTNQHMKEWPEFILNGVALKGNSVMPSPGFCERASSTVPATKFLAGTMFTIPWLIVKFFWLIVLAIIIFCAYLFWPREHAKHITVDQFYRMWQQNSTKSMHDDYVANPTVLDGVCKIDSEFRSTTEIRLKRPEMKEGKEKFGAIYVTPSAGVPHEGLPADANIKFEGKILWITDDLGVQVDQATFEVLDHPKG